MTTISIPGGESFKLKVFGNATIAGYEKLQVTHHGHETDLQVSGHGSATLVGANAPTEFIGGVGSTNMQGGTGNDTFIGGSGQEVMRGGLGHDVFAFEHGQQ